MSDATLSTITFVFCVFLIVIGLPVDADQYAATITATSDDTVVAPSALTFKAVDGSSNSYDANDTAYPADPPGSVRLFAYFPSTGSPFISKVSTDAKPDADEVSWTFKLRADITGGNLTWDVSQIPQDRAVILTTPDLSKVNLRSETETSSSYTPSGTFETYSITVSKDLPPTDLSPAAQTVTEDSSSNTFTLSATALQDGTIIYSITTNPGNGNATIANNIITYTPDANFSGTDTLTFAASHGESTATQQITITVSPVDDVATIAGDTTGSGNEDTTISGTLTATDTADGLTDKTYFTITSNPTNGTASIDAETGAWSYTPNTDYNGSDAFTVTVTDDDGYTATQKVELTISAVNDAPVADDQSIESLVGTPVTIALSATDIDNSQLTFAIVSQPLKGALTVISGSSVTFTPGSTVTDSFTFRANDSVLDSNVGTVTIVQRTVGEISTLTLQILGTVTQEGTPIGDGYQITITNQNKTNFSKTTITTGGIGQYQEGFFDLSNSVAETGDMIQVVVKSEDGAKTLGTASATYISGQAIAIDVTIYREFTLQVNQGINMIGLPLDPGKAWTLEDFLSHVTGDFMFYFDGSAFQYYGSGTTNVGVEGGTGYVVVKIGEAAEVTFSGNPWRNTHSSSPTEAYTTTFQPGINVISPPLDPGQSTTLQGLLSEIPADFMFYYDDQAFQYYGSGVTDIAVEGARGYVVVRIGSGSANHTYTGSGWENSSVASAAPANQNLAVSTTNIFAAVGQIDDLKKSEIGNLSLQLNNSRTGKTVTAALSEDGRFNFVIFDLVDRTAISVGDLLTVKIEDPLGIYRNENFPITVSQTEVKNHRLRLNPITLTKIPPETALWQNYPNPFNPETWIPFELAEDTEVRIEIYDVNGSRIRILELGHQRAGSYISQKDSAYWDGKNQFGETVSSGVYFYIFSAGNFTSMKKLLILK